MTAFKLLFFKLYLFVLSLWMGALVYTALAENEAWYADPIGYIEHVTSYPVPGASNPMWILMLFVTVCTLLCSIVFFLYQGPGKKTAYISLSATVFLLLATYFYFQPEYETLFDVLYNFNPQVVSMSRTWIVLNYIRIILLMITFFIGLIALAKFRTVKK